MLKTVLMQDGDLRKVKLLIKEYDVDVNSQGEFGYTPLHHAAEVNH